MLMPACSYLWKLGTPQRAGDGSLGPIANGTIGGGEAGGAGPDVGPLVPELAQLQWLTTLDYGPDGHSIDAAIPPEWGQPGAFPRLTR